MLRAIHRSIFTSLLAGAVLFACKGPVKFKEVKFDGFSMQVADFLTPSKNAEIRSSAFYEDTVNNCVFTVVKESKDSMIAYGQKYDLNGYYDKTFKSLASKMDDKLALENPMAYADTINNNKAIVGRIPGKVGEELLVYFLAVVETKNGFYQLIFGMPSDQETRYTKPMHTMIESFKEL